MLHGIAEETGDKELARLVGPAKAACERYLRGCGSGNGGRATIASHGLQVGNGGRVGSSRGKGPVQTGKRKSRRPARRHRCEQEAKQRALPGPELLEVIINHPLILSKKDISTKDLAEHKYTSGHFLLTKLSGNLQVGPTMLEHSHHSFLLSREFDVRACTTDGVLHDCWTQRQCTKALEQDRDPVKDCKCAQQPLKLLLQWPFRQCSPSL